MERKMSNPLLNCDAVHALLEDGFTAADKDALRLHLASCADCRAELRLRALMSQMVEEPPADLADTVMSRIRAERAKAAARLRWIRRIGTAAAAAVLVPAVVILAPILLRTGDSVAEDASVRDAETCAAQAQQTAGPEEIGTGVPTEGTTAGAPAAETAPETASDIAVTADEFADMSGTTAGESAKLMYTALATEAAVGGESSATDGETIPETAFAPQASPAETKAPATAPVSAAPDYVGPKETTMADRQTSPSTMAVDEAAAAVPQSEASFFAVIRVLVGDTALDAWLQAYDGEDAELRTALCEEFSVTRDAFTAQADAMSLTFSDAELDALFAAEES